MDGNQNLMCGKPNFTFNTSPMFWSTYCVALCVAVASLVFLVMLPENLIE